MNNSNSQTYDAIVIGGGHNGLVNANYLAKAGLNTLVLEARHLIGGAAITEELLPGYKFTTFSYALSLLRPDIVQDLDLVAHGLMVLPMPNDFHVNYGGVGLRMNADAGHNYHAVAEHSIHDAEAMDDFFHMVDRVCHAMKPLMDSIPPNTVSDAAADREYLAQFNDYLDSLDDDLKAQLERFWTGSMTEILDEYFESDFLKGYFSSSSIIGSMCSPSTPGSALVYLFHKMGEYDGEFGSWGFHKGGNGGFTQVLARAFEAKGGTIRLDSRVSHVKREGDTATGVVLEDGTEFNAKVVVSALDPKRTFMQLVDPATMPQDLIQHIEAYKFQGSAAKVNFALTDVPPFPGLEGNKSAFQGFLNIGPTLDYLETAFQDALEGRFSRRPFLDCCVQSTIDSDMTPAGKHVMSCFVMWAPYHLKDSDWDTERENLGDTVQQTIEEFFPGFSALVEHREVVTPLDIERIVGLSEGNIFAGELFSSQMFFNRPAPGWNQYRTPLAGYYQCGSGTHPGGCVIGGPGKLAAAQVLGDLEG